MSSIHSIHSLTLPMASDPASQEPGSGVSALKEEPCAICLRALSTHSLAAPSGAPLAHPANLAKQLECGHTFHQVCILAWLKDHPTCPMCNHPLVVPARPPPPTLLTATAHRRRHRRRTPTQPNKTGQRHPTANRGPVIHTLHTSGAIQPHNTVGGGRLRVGRLGGGIRKSRVRRTTGIGPTGVGPSSTK
jgi:hypothetical protein